jgi:hypothetical protein
MGWSIDKPFKFGDHGGPLGLNPTAIGILTGGILAPGAAGPMGALIGGGIGALYDRAQGAVRDGMSAMRKAERAGIANQNAIVEQGYQKLNAARGIGDFGGNPNPKKGDIASSLGVALNADGGNVNLLG